jgi:DNA polymerase (family 10)
MTNREVADTLVRIADALEILGESPFRANAYRNGARKVEQMETAVSVLHAENRLTSVPGIGSGLAEAIGQMVTTGRSDTLEQLLATVPPGLMDLISVPGLGPKRARTLYQSLGISTIGQLEEAVRSDRLAAVPGFGEKTAQSIGQRLATLERWGSRLLLADAWPRAEALAEQIRKEPGVTRVEVAGSVRRFQDSVGNINLLVETNDPAGVLCKFPAASDVDGFKEIRMNDGSVLRLSFAEPSSFGTSWVTSTGSPAHLARLCQIAGSPELPACDTEEALYAQLSLPWIPPELREDRGEIEAALAGRLPDPLSAELIRGELHMHSRYSDGSATIEEMAKACIERGYEYMAVTDHSIGLGVANGLSIERLREQAGEVRRLNAELAPFVILHGNEVNIRADGSLDYPDEVLAELDWVIASVHGAFGKSRDEQTSRILSAIANPYVNLIAHPTGRILGRRDGYDLNLDIIIDQAAHTGTSLEINCGPDRLDLDDTSVRKAAEADVTICINADAHHPDHLPWVALGTSVARRGWVGPNQVLNTGSLDAVREFVSAKRRNAGAR